MDFDPQGRRLPIKIDTTSNGEFVPLPLTKEQSVARRHAETFVGEAAKRRGLGRRQFLTSTAGAAATLLALNEANAALGARGGLFDLSRDAPFDDQLAQAELGKKEFIFDIQTHCVDPSGDWATGRDGECLTDLVITIGFYNAVVRVLASLEIDVEDSYMPYLERFPLPQG